MDMSQEAGGAEIYRDDAGCLYRGRHLVRARAVEMQTVEIQMDMSQEVCFLLRSRYSFILKEQSCCVICGYVPLCSTQRVPRCFNYVVGSLARV